MTTTSARCGDMQFPFETTVNNRWKATVLGVMPDGRLIGYIEFQTGLSAWDWDADGVSHPTGYDITLQPGAPQPDRSPPRARTI